jgi:predicted dehydrogenase
MEGPRNGANRSERLGIGFVGAGGIARARHVPGFRRIRGVDLVSVATSSEASARRAAGELGFWRHAGSAADVIRDPEVDAVVIATWPDQHAPLVIEALQAGKPVLTQARMAMNATEAAAMLVASRARPDLAAMVVPSPISLFADAAILRLIRDGAIGSVRMARVTWSGNVYGIDPWRRLRRLSGNNTMSLGIVYEALARWVGHAHAVSATASIVEPTMAGPDGRPVTVDVPDHLLATLELPGNALASIELSATPRPEPNLITIHGSSGSLRIDVIGRRIGHSDANGRWRRVAIPPSERGRWRVERDFVDAIRLGKRVTLTDFATGWRYMAFTDAVVASAASGRRMEIPSSPA